jgi:hypothetical protein
MVVVVRALVQIRGLRVGVVLLAYARVVVAQQQHEYDHS